LRLGVPGVKPSRQVTRDRVVLGIGKD